jgi:hypothetical protein
LQFLSGVVIPLFQMPAKLARGGRTPVRTGYFVVAVLKFRGDLKKTKYPALTGTPFEKGEFTA